MNWRLIFQLSFFGLAMALLTISLIPTSVEPFFWLIIFIVCAYIIAKRCSGNYFLYGFLVSMVNCIWITAVHIFFYNSYVAHHPEMQSMSAHLPLPNHPRLMMLFTGPVFGAVFGLILGLFSFVSAKLMKK
jgi:hypothetical protein